LRDGGKDLALARWQFAVHLALFRKDDLFARRNDVFFVTTIVYRNIRPECCSQINRFFLMVFLVLLPPIGSIEVRIGELECLVEFR
jgi:hypothetical protein